MRISGKTSSEDMISFQAQDEGGGNKIVISRMNTAVQTG
jgi:hypothetical protein